jgi:hypothetical protein
MFFENNGKLLSKKFLVYQNQRKPHHVTYQMKGLDLNKKILRLKFIFMQMEIEYWAKKKKKK